MKKTLICLLAFLPLIFLNSCSDDDDDDNDFDVPELTLENSIQCSVNIASIAYGGGNSYGEDDGKKYSYAYDPFEVNIVFYGKKIAIDWGDGTVDKFYSVQPDISPSSGTDGKSHRYASVGEYTIKIWSEGLDFFRLNSRGNAPHKEYNQWFDNVHIAGANNLTALSLSGIKTMTSINWSGCPNLQNLGIIDNGFEILDLSKLKDLYSLYCSHNNLKELNIEKNTKLLYLVCDYNKITDLDVSKNTELRILNCTNNNLSADVLNTIFTDLPQNPAKTKDSPPVSYQIGVFDNPGSETCDTKIITDKGWQIMEKWIGE